MLSFPQAVLYKSEHELDVNMGVGWGTSSRLVVGVDTGSQGRLALMSR